MLSDMSVSPGVTSPSSSPEPGRGAFTLCPCGWDDALLVSDELVEHQSSFPWVDVPVASSGFLEGAVSSSSAANRLDFAVVGTFGFPAIDVRLVPRFDRVKEEGLEKMTFFFFADEDEEGVTDSSVCLTGILTGREVAR